MSTSSHFHLTLTKKLLIFREYASGGELLDHILAKGKLSEDEARRYFRQLISAIEHCHTAHVVHRDLKLENLLRNADNELLLSDFGLGRTFRNEDEDLMMVRNIFLSLTTLLTTRLALFL